MSKRASKLVPHVLNARQRQDRFTFCRTFLQEYQGRPDRMNWILTCDESYFHVYDPLSKMESKEWLTRDMNRPQTVRRELAVKKVMFLPFFDRKGVVHAEFIEGTTVTKEVFHGVIQRMRTSLRTHQGAAVWAQRHRMKIHMDNASAHRSTIVQDLLDELTFPRLKHPAYSLDLSPCDFFLFPILKKMMRGNDYHTVDNVKQAVLDCIGRVTQVEWEYCFDQWISRCQKCIQFDGRYFEGMKHGPQ